MDKHNHSPVTSQMSEQTKLLTSYAQLFFLKVQLSILLDHLQLHDIQWKWVLLLLLCGNQNASQPQMNI